MRIHLRHKQQHFTIELESIGSTHRALVDGVAHAVELQRVGEGTFTLVVDGRSYCVALAHKGRERLVAVGGETYAFVPETGASADHSLGTVAAPEITAPMPGKVLHVLVRPGDHVAVGDGLLILEAMKMENRLIADAPGIVTEVRVADGDTVEGGQVLVVLSYDTAAHGA